MWLLVELLDRRHFASGFGSFDAVAKQDDASVDGEKKGGQDAENQTRPYGSEPGEVNGRTVEEIQDPVVEGVLESTKLVTPRKSSRTQKAASAVENLAQIRRETANFRQFRKLTEQWVELSLKASQLREKNGETPT